MSKLEKDMEKAAERISMINAVIPCDHCRKEICHKEHLVVYHARPESKEEACGTVPVVNAHRSVFCDDRCLRKYLKFFKLQKDC